MSRILKLIFLFSMLYSVCLLAGTQAVLAEIETATNQTNNMSISVEGNFVCFDHSGQNHQWINMING